MQIIGGVMVGDPGDAAVHVGPTQVFGRHDFARGGLDQRRTAQEDGARPLEEDKDKDKKKKKW